MYFFLEVGVMFMPRGRPPKDKSSEIKDLETKEIKKNKTVNKNKYRCFYCRKEFAETNFYKSNSIFYSNIGKLPYCKQCIEKFYQYFYEKYTNEGCLAPEKKAIQRLCMIFDVYYKEDVYNFAIDDIEKRGINISPMGAYMKMIQLSQYNRKKETYENTISEAEQERFAMSAIIDASSNIVVDQKITDFWGKGFTDEDYTFLQREYDDWVTRHECQTKAQEEVFKRICFKQLEILKATRLGEDTKNLDDTFQKLLDTAKLQPKQNSGEAMSDAQTFGTLIDKWENTRPIPEIEPELKDVDKIGYLIHVFYTGHMAKVLNLKSSLTNIYDKYIKKYTVEKPEYNGESDNEVLFDTIFGKRNIDEEDV